jgi:hypothetical protein
MRVLLYLVPKLRFGNRPVLETPFRYAEMGLPGHSEYPVARRPGRRKSRNQFKLEAVQVASWPAGSGEGVEARSQGSGVGSHQQPAHSNERIATCIDAFLPASTPLAKYSAALSQMSFVSRLAVSAKRGNWRRAKRTRESSFFLTAPPHPARQAQSAEGVKILGKHAHFDQREVPFGERGSRV